MRKPPSSHLILGLVSLVSLIFCSCKSIDGDERILSESESVRIKRFLHPLPQELRLSGAAYEIPVANCGISDYSDASELAKKMLDDFKARWATKRGAELTNAEKQLTIIAGILKNTPKLQKAAKKGVFDAKYLSERPNHEQAYALATIPKDGRVKVYVAANAPPGLYYGLLTLEQLFEGLSGTDNLILPHANIVDWPDIRWRGSWTSFGQAPKSIDKADRLKFYENRVKRFSNWKFNLADEHLIQAHKVDAKGDVQVHFSYRNLIKFGEQHAVKIQPHSTHIPHYFPHTPGNCQGSSLEIQRKFPKAKGQPENPGAKNNSLCFSHTDSHEFVKQFLVSTAKQFESATLWITEGRGKMGVCHCSKCAGDIRQGFTNEVKAIMAAYREAKKVNPSFQLNLLFSQGSYPHNLAILKYIPKDVKLFFYHGTMTYKTSFQRYNLPPSLQEMKRLGYSVGSVPSPVPWSSPLCGPFQTPVYIRMLCGEAEDRGLDMFLAYLSPNPFCWDFNSQALAEYLWNSNGRTPSEFTLSWAMRKKLDQPAETAAIIEMMEYPERGLRNCENIHMVANIADFVAGKARANKTPLKGFEYKTHEEMVRILAICQDAVDRSAKIDNPELNAACQLMLCWAIILERYSYCVENPQGDLKEAISTIKRQFKLCPKLFQKWMDTRKMISPRRIKGIMRVFQKIISTPMSEALKEPSLKTSQLLQAAKSGDLLVMELDSKWKFKPSPSEIGLKEKWYSAKLDDSSWPVIKAGQGHGWEKEGYEGLTGYAWYRQKMTLPEKMTSKKHLYLLFKGVDEDAEIYVNGQKLFTHSYKTVGGAASSTWNKPFSLDIIKNMKSGENLIAVRVYNRAKMGGIWKPVFLVATDQTAETKDLAPVAAR